MGATDNTLRQLKSQKTVFEADVEDLRNNLTRLKRSLDQAESDLKEQNTVNTRQTRELNDLLQELRSEKRSLTNCMNDQSNEIAKLNNDVALSKIRVKKWAMKSFSDRGCRRKQQGAAKATQRISRPRGNWSFCCHGVSSDG